MYPTSRLSLGLSLLASLGPFLGSPLIAAETYSPGPDSQVKAGVPQGELVKYDFAASKIFPGTTRNVTIYIPKQYDPAKPACVFVDQDGVQFNAPTVFAGTFGATTSTIGTRPMRDSPVRSRWTSNGSFG